MQYMHCGKIIFRKVFGYFVIILFQTDADAIKNKFADIKVLFTQSEKNFVRRVFFVSLMYCTL